MHMYIYVYMYVLPVPDSKHALKICLAEAWNCELWPCLIMFAGPIVILD